LRRRSLSEEDELDELDELERPISLAPITAFPLQTITLNDQIDRFLIDKFSMNISLPTDVEKSRSKSW